MNVYLFSKITKNCLLILGKDIPNFAIAKLQSYQQADYLNITNNNFHIFATTKTIYNTHNQHIR